MGKRVFNWQLLIPLFAVPVLLFLSSRMGSFFADLWGITTGRWFEISFLAACLLGIFLVRGRLYDFLVKEAYGVSVFSVPIYILSVLCALRYKNVVLKGCEGGGILLVAGGGILLGLFVLLCMKAADDLLKKLMTSKVCKRDILVVFVTALFLNIQAIVYCLLMKKIFVWDNAGYFLTIEALNDIFPSYEYFKEVYNSVFTTDYNYLIAVPLQVFRKLFGPSRLVFVLSVINMYVLPLYCLIYALTRRIFKKGIWVYICTLLAIPYIVFAADTGFVDIGGVFFGLLALVLFMYGSDRMSLLSGVLLALCVLLRRWYSFYALSFIISGFVYALVCKNFKKPIYTLLGFAFVLLFFAQPFVSGKLLADYGSIYSAYALGMGVDMRLITRYFGLIIPLVSTACAIYLVAKKKNNHNIFIILIGIICFVLFTRIQTHGQQHLALYVPVLIMLILSALSTARRNSFISLLVIICIGQTASTFIKREQPQSIGEIKTISVLPSFTFEPPVDKNAMDFLKVCEYMDREIGEKGFTAVFLASSVEMNYDTLRNAEKSLNISKKSDIDRESYYLPISDVDTRDGVSDNLFNADYVFVPSCLQLHLHPSQQQVIEVPYRQITEGWGIGTAYEQVKTKFTLTTGEDIFVYRRIRELTADEILTIKKEILQ